MSRLALCCPGYSTTSLECGGCSLLLELDSLQSLCSTFSSTMSLWKGHSLRIPRIGRWFSIQGGKGQRDRGWRKPERRRERGSRARIPLVHKVVREECQGRYCGERTYKGKDTKDQANISHCVTGAVSTHDVMYTGFYFWKPLKSALCTKGA